LRVDFAVVAFALVAFAAVRGRACFAVTAGRLAERRRALWGRGDFFGFLADFAAALLFAADRLRVAVFRAAVRTRRAAVRPLAFLVRAAGRRRVARAAFRLAMRRPFGSFRGRSYLDSFR
jgi:hypothetical protein